MPTVILDPTGVGTNGDAWVNSGGANKTASVNLPDDEATTRIQSTTDSDEQSFVLEDMPADANVINSAVVTARASESAANASMAIEAWQGVASTAGSEIALTTSWVDYTMTPPQATFTNTVALINSLEIGVQHITDTGQFSRVTSLYLTVVYQTDDGEQFLMFLTSWLPPLLAVASHGLSVGDISRILRKMKNRPSDKWEFQKILRAFILRPRFMFT